VTKLSLTEARAKLADLVSEAQYGGKVTIITRHGKAAAAIVPTGLVPDQREDVKKPAVPAVKDTTPRKSKA
jgi:prevent-host-death family protein